MLNRYLNTVYYVKLGSLSTKIMIDWRFCFQRSLKPLLVWALWSRSKHLLLLVPTLLRRLRPTLCRALLDTCCFCCSLLPAAHVSFSSLVASTSHSPPPASGLRARWWWSHEIRSTRRLTAHTTCCVTCPASRAPPPSRVTWPLDIRVMWPRQLAPDNCWAAPHWRMVPTPPSASGPATSGPQLWHQ